MNGKGKMVSLVVLVVGLVVLLGIWGVFRKPTLVTVYGEGAVKVVPSMVRFTISFSNQGDSANIALADNERISKQLISLLKNAGVDESDIVVSYVRVLPPSLTQPRYQAVNAIDVTLKELGSFDNLVTSLYANGAQSISNILFTTENSGELEKQAVADAITGAKARAGEIAKAAGKRVGRMVSIQTTQIGEAGALVGEAPKATFGTITTSSPSQIEIIRGATVIFELK